MFENEYKFVKKQIADFFEVTERTIELCLEKHARELERNGYEVLRGKRLMDFKLVVQNSVGAEIDFGTKTTVLGIYNFRTLLNIAMLLTDNRNHSFSDGNKRLSITIGVLFLSLNGYLYCIKRFLSEMENISYHLAAGRIEKELLDKLISSILDGEEDFNEQVKMELFLAIADETIGFDE